MKNILWHVSGMKRAFRTTLVWALTTLCACDLRGRAARLAGLEPATGCLEATGRVARMVPDLGCGSSADRQSSAGFRMVATATGYRSRPRAGPGHPSDRRPLNP